jgi:hypothetical protein
LTGLLKSIHTASANKSDSGTSFLSADDLIERIRLNGKAQKVFNPGDAISHQRSLAVASIGSKASGDATESVQSQVRASDFELLVDMVLY